MISLLLTLLFVGKGSATLSLDPKELDETVTVVHAVAESDDGVYMQTYVIEDLRDSIEKSRTGISARIYFTGDSLDATPMAPYVAVWLWPTEEGMLMEIDRQMVEDALGS